MTWLNTSVFSRPARGNPGNSSTDVVRGPGINNSDVTLFKNQVNARFGQVITPRVMPVAIRRVF